MILWSLTDARAVPELMHGSAPVELLSDPERSVASRLRFGDRRRDWILGRIAAKSLVCAWLADRGRIVAPSAVTIEPSPDGSPRVRIGRDLAPLTVSLSHRRALCVCILTEGQEVPLGVDLELCEPRSHAFVEDFFTAAEAAAVAGIPPDVRARIVASTWTVKEAVLKALRLGLRADTRRVDCVGAAPPGEDWSAVDVRLDPRLGPCASALVRSLGACVVAVARVGPPALTPAELLRFPCAPPPSAAFERAPEPCEAPA